ncbi:hypothetical protein F0U62_08925 [Cystobacter fuscus]|uniref:hypothetical protein n=1 Tax=Cystobacter fuscus TaxID=43 RepID=UPI002B2E6BD8|nr:hypothetical protein F0U62_08925 [Cystobacter fuscus]
MSPYAYAQAQPCGQRVPKDDPRELGPERPLQGVSEDEARVWRDQRAGKLYLKDPELSAAAIAERLGRPVDQTCDALNRAGIKGVKCRGGERNALPAGLPL